MEMDKLGVVTSFVHNIVVYNIPLLYGTVGEIMVEKSGSLNLGVEGIMAVGAIFGYIIGCYTNSLLIGILTAFLAGALCGLLFAALTVSLQANQNVTGLTLTTFGLGVYFFVGNGLKAVRWPAMNDSSGIKNGFANLPIPGLSKLPLIGEGLFDHNLLVYLGVVIAIVATVLGHDITFWEWSALGMPLVFVTLFACFAITALLFPVGKAGKGFSMPEGYLKKKIEALGPVSAHEHAAIWIMVVALALWCSGPQIFSALGLEEEARMMTAPVIAVLMGASAFLVPIRRDRESGRLIFAMNWDQAVRNIGWGIIVLQIGAIAFGQVLLKGGVDKWMAQCIQMLLGDIHGLLVWFALVFITGFFSQIIMSLAVIPLMLPITAGLAGIYGFDPLLACISVGFVSNLTTMFPFSSVPVAAVIAGSEGYAQPKDFIISGFLNTTIVTVITFGLCWLVGPMVL